MSDVGNGYYSFTQICDSQVALPILLTSGFQKLQPVWAAGSCTLGAFGDNQLFPQTTFWL